MLIALTLVNLEKKLLLMTSHQSGYTQVSSHYHEVKKQIPDLSRSIPDFLTEELPTKGLTAVGLCCSTLSKKKKHLQVVRLFYGCPISILCQSAAPI